MTVVAKAEMPDQDKTVKQLLHKIVSQNTEAQVWRQSIDRRVGVLEATLPERHNLIQQPKAVVKTKVVKTKVKPVSTLDPRLAKLKALKAKWGKDDPRHSLCSQAFSVLKTDAKVVGWWTDKEEYISCSYLAYEEAEHHFALGLY